MPYKFSIDQWKCIQCGICGDVCPVNALDFSRPEHKHPEDTKKSVDLTQDMTEYPVQVNKCIGCMICPEECPVSCITISNVDNEPKYMPIQGPMLKDEPAKDEFALSKYTKVRPTKVKVKDPWGHVYIYKPKRRKSTTGTWNELDEKS